MSSIKYAKDHGFAPATKQEIEAWNLRIDVEKQAKLKAEETRKVAKKRMQQNGTQSTRT